MVTYYNRYNCRPSYGFLAVTSTTSGSSGGSGSVSTFDDTYTFTAGETLFAKDVVFIKNDGKVYRAIALSISASFNIGVAISGAVTDATVPVDTRQGKVLNYFSGLISGSRYFLSESYGLIDISSPQNKDSMVYQVGIAKSSTELLFYPDLLVLK